MALDKWLNLSVSFSSSSSVIVMSKQVNMYEVLGKGLVHLNTISAIIIIMIVIIIIIVVVCCCCCCCCCYHPLVAMGSVSFSASPLLLWVTSSTCLPSAVITASKLARCLWQASSSPFAPQHPAGPS